MRDFLYSGVLTDHQVAFGYAVTTQLANEAVLAHDCDPVAAHLLTRSLTAGVLYTPHLQSGERVNIVWHYHGQLRSVIVDAGTNGGVRGLVSPTHLSESEGEEWSHADLFGNDDGLVKVLRSRDGELVSSSIGSAQMHDVVEDFVMTLCISDQVETGASILVGFDTNPKQPVALCQGVLIQAMPDADLLVFDGFRQRLARPDFRELIGRETEADNHFEAVLRELTGEDAPNYRIEEKTGPEWRCTCSREKMSAVITTLPATDRDEIIAAGEPVRVRCEFCNTLYELTVEECKAVWQAETERAEAR